MKRRDFVRSVGAFAALPLAGTLMAPAGLLGRADKGGRVVKGQDRQDWEPLEKSKEEWERILTPEEFAVLRKEDTERAHSSPLNEETRPGTYICAGCFLPLFSADTKFKSGTGWPSFTAPIEGHMDTKRDFKLIWPRTEYHCARCGGHQGHVFDDGPEPTGQRWCNNGVALDFVPEGQELPELRQ